MKPSNIAAALLLSMLAFASHAAEPEYNPVTVSTGYRYTIIVPTASATLSPDRNVIATALIDVAAKGRSYRMKVAATHCGEPTGEYLEYLDDGKTDKLLDWTMYGGKAVDLIAFKVCWFALKNALPNVE
jgi:hypothetical protein